MFLGCSSSAVDDRLWLCRLLAAGGYEVTDAFVSVSCRVYAHFASFFLDVSSCMVVFSFW